MTEFDRIKAMDVVDLAIYINKLQSQAVDDYIDGYYPKGIFENVSMLKKEVQNECEEIVGVDTSQDKKHTQFGLFRDWFEKTRDDLDICVIDKQGNKHFLPSICYIAPEDLECEDIFYSDTEQWLFTLPLEDLDFGKKLAVLKVDFNEEELGFLGLIEIDREELSPEVSNLFLRADMANAGFTERLDYLMEGKPFEVPFDAERMDVVKPSDRLFVCDFIQDFTEIYVRKDTSHANYLYGIIPDTSPVEFDLLGIQVKQTEPGKGLTSIFDGKCAWADYRARRVRAEVMQNNLGFQISKDDGKEFDI